MAFPAVIPVTMPEDKSTVAIPGADEDHVPPETGSVKVAVELAHNTDTPVTGNGNGLTVTVLIAEHNP